jgi:hypothetical protein
MVADWQKKKGKNPKGGLNEAGRKSYEAQNPGSNLKAPVKSGDNPRRASFWLEWVTCLDQNLKKENQPDFYCPLGHGVQVQKNQLEN